MHLCFKGMSRLLKHGEEIATDAVLKEVPLNNSIGMVCIVIHCAGICVTRIQLLASGTENLVSRRSKYFPPVCLLSLRLNSDLAVPGGPRSSKCSPERAVRIIRRTCRTGKRESKHQLRISHYLVLQQHSLLS